MGFKINVGTLYALAHSKHLPQLQFCPSSELVATCINVPDCIHIHTNRTALQENLHECVGWLIARSIGVSDTATCHIPEDLPLIFVIACGLPQLVLLMSVTYRQLKGTRIVRCIAGQVGTLLKKIHTRNQAGDDDLSDADSLPH